MNIFEPKGDAMLILPICFSLVVVIAITACSAQMVSLPGATSSSPYAPVNEESRLGMVKYLNTGADNVIQQRREDAYKQMYAACNGKYRIDAEGPRTEGGVVMPVGKSIIYDETQYWYIQFSCTR